VGHRQLSAGNVLLASRSALVETLREIRDRKWHQNERSLLHVRRPGYPFAARPAHRWDYRPRVQGFSHKTWIMIWGGGQRCDRGDCMPCSSGGLASRPE